MQNLDRTDFFQRIAAVFDGVPLGELSDDALVFSLTAAQHAADMALLEAEGRGLIGSIEGAPCVPYRLPEGVEPIETILTRRA